jgi:ferrous iron transport protein A
MGKGGVLPLGFLEAGRGAVVQDLNGGRSLRQRLIELGLVRGAKIKVIKNETGGPLIISVAEGRLAIGRGMALKIMVEESN